MASGTPSWTDSGRSPGPSSFPPLAWVEGRVVRLEDARVPLEDRGFLFGESVYEGLIARNGRAFAGKAHLERLERSALGIGLDPARFHAEVDDAVRTLLRVEPREAFLYLQVTGGVGPRDHLPPGDGFPPAVFATLRPYDRDWLVRLQAEGLAAATEEDSRWGLATYKTTQLLANILAKRRARDRGAQEVLFFDADGCLLEGGSTNVFVVRKGQALTAPLHRNLLPGITRRLLLDHFGDRVREQEIRIQDLARAEEVFVASTTRPVVAVTSVDGRPVGSGRPGPFTRALGRDFLGLMDAELG